MAISDISGAYYRKDGSTFPSAMRYALAQRQSARRAIRRPSIITNDELLELDVDVLIPAALGGVITAENADRIKAPIIIEAANAPIRPDADDMLADRGVRIVPDILANAGGVTVSYFEWAQNRQFYHWNLDRVRQELDQTSVHRVRRSLESRPRAQREFAHRRVHDRHQPRRPRNGPRGD